MNLVRAIIHVRTGPLNDVKLCDFKGLKHCTFLIKLMVENTNSIRAWIIQVTTHTPLSHDIYPSAT